MDWSLGHPWMKRSKVFSLCSTLGRSEQPYLFGPKSTFWTCLLCGNAQSRACRTYCVAFLGCSFEVVFMKKRFKLMMQSRFFDPCFISTDFHPKLRQALVPANSLLGGGVSCIAKAPSISILMMDPPAPEQQKLVFTPHRYLCPDDPLFAEGF